MKRYLTMIHTAAPAPYNCLRCGRELYLNDTRWSCVCGEEYQITSYTDKELEDLYREDDVPESCTANGHLAKDAYVRSVLEAFCIEFTDLVGARRVRNYVMAREIVAHYLFKKKGCSVARVGELIGGRAPATAFHLLKLYETDLQYDSQFRKNLEDVNLVMEGYGSKKETPVND